MEKATDNLELLLVEDNPADMFLLKQMLHTSSLEIQTIYEASRLEEARQIMGSHNVQLALLDLSLPDSFGINSYLSIKKVSKKVPVIILTGQGDTGMALEAIKEGAQDYLVKGEFNTYWLTKSVQYSMERMQNMERLRESEEKYRQMFHRNPFPSMIIDLTTLKILEANDSAIEKYGYSREEFLEMDLEDIRPKEDIDSLYQLIAGSGTKQGAQKLMRHKKKSGEIMFMEVSYYPIGYFGKTAMQAQMNDVTEKIRLEKQLKQEQELRQRQITMAVLEAQEKERIAIGEELHDNINQIITSARLYIDLAKKKKDPEKELLEKAMEYTTLAIEENRRLSKNLILPQLKGEGLINSLTDLQEQLMHTSSIRIKFDIDHFDEDFFSDSEKVSLFRIVQEQLNNIIKHAAARSVLIRLYKENDKIILLIKDNGKGFDVSAKRNGVGLTNISSRAEVLNGKLEIHSAPGEGCELKIVIDTE
jgi:two-component system, NarL family, sensor histidine kinase UhpB